MGLVEELLGCSLLEIDRSYWAVKLNNEEWVCEARVKTNVYSGEERQFDWSNDLVANRDVNHIKELWLLCPPSRTSPLGNTARLDIEAPKTAFQFKVTHVDSTIAETVRNLPYHIIGRVDDAVTGDCTCFIFDPVQGGLLTTSTLIFDPLTAVAKKDHKGKYMTAGRNNIYNFHSWDPGRVAHLGRLELNTLGLV